MTPKMYSSAWPFVTSGPLIFSRSVLVRLTDAPIATIEAIGTSRSNCEPGLSHFILDRDGLQMRVHIEGFMAMFAADPALLITSER